MSTGLFAITDALQASQAAATAHQTQTDAAVTALKTEADSLATQLQAIQAAPPSGVTPEQLNAVAASVSTLGTHVSTLESLVGAPDPTATPVASAS